MYVSEANETDQASDQAGEDLQSGDQPSGSQSCTEQLTAAQVDADQPSTSRGYVQQLHEDQDGEDDASASQGCEEQLLEDHGAAGPAVEDAASSGEAVLEITADTSL